MLTESTALKHVSRLERLHIVADFPWDWEYWQLPDGTFAYMSPSCQRMTGYKPEAFNTNPQLLYEIVHPEDVQKVKAHKCQEVGNTIEPLEFRIFHADGYLIWIEHLCHALRDKSGQFIGCRATNRDITDRKAVQEELYKSYLDRNLIIELAEIGTWEYEPGSDRIIPDEQFKVMFGMPESLKSIHFEKLMGLIHPDDRSRVHDLFRQCIEVHEDTFGDIHRIIRPDRTTRWVSAKGRAFYEKGDHNPIRMFGTVYDVTDIKQAHEETEKERRRLKAVLDILPVGVFIANGNGQLITVNPAAEKIWGGPVKLSNAIEDYKSDYRAWWPDGRPVETDQWALARAITQGLTTLRDEVEIETADGNRKSILNYGLPIRDEEGHVTGGVAVNVDVTQRKQTEQALRRAQEVAHVGSWLMNIKKNELVWSDETYRIFGIPAGTPMRYESFMACVHPDDRPAVEKAWQTAMLSRTDYNVRHRIVAGDKVKWVQEISQLEFDRDGTLLGAFGTCQDITRLKETEDALIKSREDFIRAQKMAHVGSWKLENDQWEWSEETYRIFELPVGTPVPFEKFLSFVHPDDLPVLQTAWNAAIARRQETGYEVEHRAVVPSGIKWIRERAEMRYDEQGNAVYIFGTCQDVTYLKEAERQLIQRTEEAEESKRLLDAIMEHVPVGITVLDVPDTKIRLMSRFGAELINMGKREHFEGTDDWARWKLRRPEGHPIAVEEMPLFKAVHLRQTVESEEYIVDTEKNVTLHLLVSAGPIMNDAGETIGAIAIWQDITGLKAAEKRLQQRTAEAEEGKRLLEAIMEYIPVGLTIVDPNEHIRAISRSALELMGIAREEIDSQQIKQLRQIWQVLLPENGQVSSDQLPVVEALEKGQTIRERELIIRSTQGTLTPVLTTAAPIKDEDSRTVGGILVWQDITMRKEADKQLRRRTAEAEESALLLDLIMEHVPVGIMVAESPKINIRLISQFGSQLLDNGRRSDFENTIIDQQKEIWDRLQAENGQAVGVEQLPLREAIISGKTIENKEFVFPRPNGSTVYLLISAGPIRNKNGQLIGGILVWQDITELKKAEQSLRVSRQNLLDLKEQLENKNKELESIIGIVSHDLRSPLVSIGGFSHEIEFSCDAANKILSARELTPGGIETLQRILDSEIPEFLNYIQSSTAKMDALVRSLVKVARAGMAEVRPEPLDMNQLLADASAAIGFEIKESETELEIGKLPGCFADRTQTNQIFSNLLDNCIKYLDPNRPGRIRVSGRVEGNHSVYCVQDNGIGIALQHLEHIFDLFSRLDRTKAPGEGIGLAMVKRMVARNNGSIWVESEVGKGSCFCVSLPRSADE